MTNRIDHFAEARRLVLATETRDWNQESPYVDRRLAAAQVHATLALAEQQHLANVIALAGLGMGGPLRHLAVQPMGEISVQPTDDIAAALGIEAKS